MSLPIPPTFAARAAARARQRVAPALLLGLLGDGAAAQSIDAQLLAVTATVVRGVVIGEGALDLHAVTSWSAPSGWRAALGAAALHARSQSGRWDAQIFVRGGVAVPLDDDWSAQAGLARYAYPGSPLADRYARDELGATLAYRDLVYLSATGLRYTRQYPGARDAAAVDVVVRWPLAASFSAVAGAGRLAARGSDFAYGYGHLGLAAAWGDTQAQLVHIATGSAARERFGDYAANRWVASLGRRF